MSSIDERTVKMQFDNATFKKEAAATKTSLDQVDAAVAKTGGNKGLLGLSSGMDTVRVKAGAMQVAAVTALANITNRAVNAGISMAKSFTLDPIKAGFDEYELKMKSIQTILANTKGENLKSVTATLNELNTYADKTIYNFGNMTDAIGKMTTAGIDLKTATSTVKGFHNMVALAGGDSNAAAGALEQFNQGLQAGVIKLVDWKSLQTRGLGSQALQQSFFETARAAGTLKDVDVDTTFAEWTKANGGFNATLESGWLTADVATKSYAIMAGEFTSVKQLMKEGFSEEAAKNLLATAKNAEDSATKVRTLTAFTGTLKEQLGSGWSQVMETLFGDFNEATTLFTSLSNTSGKLISTMFDGINSLVGGWDKLGGRAAIFTTIKNIISPFSAIFGRIGDAVQLAFGGGKGGSFLADFSKALEHLTRPLNILGKLIRGEISPLEAFERVITVIKNAVRNFFEYVGGSLPDFSKLFKLDVPSDGILGFLKDIGRAIRDAVGGLDKLLDKGSSVAGAFKGVTAKVPGLPDIPDLPGLPDIGGIVGGDSAAGSSKVDAMSASVGHLKDTLGKFTVDSSPLRGFIDTADKGTGSLDNMSASTEGAANVGDKVMPLIAKSWENIKKFFSNFNLEDLMASFNLAVLSTFVISASKLMNTLSNSFEGFVGIGDGVKGVLTAAQEGFKSFQTAARAKLILAIGIAIGILAVSLWILSRIPMDKLITGLIGMAGVMIILKVGIDTISKAVERMDGKGTGLKLTGLSIALLALGAAVLLLATAFLIMNKVDWSSILKGLITIVVVMKSLETLANTGDKAAGKLVAAAFAIGAVALSMVILAGALLLFKLVDYESMGKAGLVLGALTVALGALSLIPAGVVAKVGSAMLGMSVSMLLLANALLIFQLVKWESIWKAGVILAFLTISLAALIYAGGGPVGAAVILAMGAALLMIAAAGMMLNEVDWSSIGKIALIIGILVVGFAAFLAVVTIFAPVLIILSAFAGSIALLALAITGLMLAFAVIMPLMALGTGAFAAFATGAAVAIGVFLTSLALQAPIMKKSILKIMQVAIDGIVEGVPMVIQGFKDLWAAIKKEFSGGGGGGGAKNVEASVGKSSQGWMDKIGDIIKKYMPKIVAKAVELGGKFIDGLTKKAPAIAAKGVELIIGLLNGIASKAGDLAEAAINLIIKLAEGIGAGAARLAKAGIRLIAEFLHDLADAIRSGAAAVGSGLTDVIDAMKDVGIDAVKGLISGLKSMVTDAVGSIKDLASDMINAAKDKFKIFSPSRVFRDIGKFLVEGLSKGVRDNASAAIVEVASMVGGSIAVATEYMSKFVQDLDQQALAATARAEGLQAAAAKAAKAAEKTKNNNKDDRAANRLQNKADAATTAAEKRQAQLDAAREKADRQAEYADATLSEAAQMKAEDSTATLDEAKAAELEAESKRQEADALRAQAKAKGVSAKDAKALRAQADKLDKQAAKAAERANTLLEAARGQAGEAMELQRQAAAEAVADFDRRYLDEANKDAAEDAYNKMTDEQKIEERKRQAAELQAKADADLARAKVLAYTDLDGANELAQQAIDGANQARDYLREAEDMQKQLDQAKDQQSESVGGEVVNLDPTEAAGIAFGNYSDLYDSAYAAAAGGSTVEFNQYNTSPEALNPTDVYRNTNNQLDFAANRLNPAA